MQESSAFMAKAFIIAILLIALVLVTQFDSVVTPFIIMTSVILSFIGIFLGLLVTHTPFGVIMTGMGVISLAGVVVNNAPLGSHCFRIFRVIRVCRMSP